MCNQIAQNLELMEEIAPGVFLDWLHDRQIVVMCLINTSRSTIDDYIEASLNIIDNWPPDKPYLALKELGPKQIVSRYFRLRSNEIGQRLLERGLRGRSAIVCPHDTTADMVDMVIRMDGAAVPYMQRKTFSRWEPALDWVLQELNE